MHVSNKASFIYIYIYLLRCRKKEGNKNIKLTDWTIG